MLQRFCAERRSEDVWRWVDWEGLGDFWWDFGELLKDYGEILVRFWWDFGEILMRLWWDYGEILVGFWWDFGEILVRLLWDYGEILVGFWWDFGEILVIFWRDFDEILAVVRKLWSLGGEGRAEGLWQISKRFYGKFEKSHDYHVQVIEVFFFKKTEEGWRWLGFWGFHGVLWGLERMMKKDFKF